MIRRSMVAMATVIVCAGLIGLSAKSALAASPYGNWKRPKNGAIIKVYKCAGGLGMKVVSSPRGQSVGSRMMCGAKKSGSQSWSGTLTNPEDGKKYAGTVTVRGNRLTLTGCVLSIFCKSETWRRN